jgi:hypothetical protein
MTTELERRLRDAFHEDAQRARLVHRLAPAEPATPIRSQIEQPRSSGWLLGVAAVTTLFVVGGVVLIQTARDADPARIAPSPTDAPQPTSVAPTPSTLPAPTTIGSVPVVSVPVTIPPSTVRSPALWVELEAAATASLPPAPITAHNASALVWTGAEMIVWGGTVNDQPCCSESQEGAAFDPAAGSWRQIAPPPDDVVTPAVVVWTGTEMLVFSDGSPESVSAAYDPAADTWRLIANPPVPASAALWVGDAAVLLPDPDVNDDGYDDAPSPPGYAYDPTTDQWRRLAEGPWGRGIRWANGSVSAVWTGTRIITLTERDPDDGMLLNAYDPATDTWEALGQSDTVVQPVVIPGRGVALLPLDLGVPVVLLDDRGNMVGELAGRPEELALTCQRAGENACLLTSLRALSVGGEMLFWYSDDGWAFDPETQVWRSEPLDGRQPGWDGTEVVAAGDLLFAWGAGKDGLVYRAAV